MAPRARSVRQLLEDCVATLPEPFTTGDVLRWFAERYPDVASQTIRTHIAGLTSGPDGRAQHQFAHHDALLERVERGLYRRAVRRDGGAALEGVRNHGSAAETAASHLPANSPYAADVVLVGCVKSKRDVAAPARDLYVSPLFARRRAYAEASGVPWYVVSSRWGLLAPSEVVAPYELYLGDQPLNYRRAWGAFVAAQLAVAMPLDGSRVEVHAGDVYVNALRLALEALGAEVMDVVDARSMGETLAWYDHRSHDVREPAEHGRRQALAVSALVAALSDSTQAMAPEALRAAARSVSELDRPGLYTWWVDEQGAEDLTVGLASPVHPGLLYAGQAGATHWPSGKRSSNTLRARLVGMHLGGRAAMSTFRRTLAAALTPVGAPIDEQVLTAWMDAHLRVIAVPVPDADGLADLEREVLERLDPPFNLRHMAATQIRRELSRRRSTQRV